MSFVDNNKLKVIGVKLGQPFSIVERLVCRDGPVCQRLEL